jgi:glycosyltransferase involved in cell wall biosynthesis
MHAEADPIDSSFLTGRASYRPPGAQLEVEIDGDFQLLVPLGREREFSVALPEFVFDGATHQVQVRIAGQREWFRNCPLRFQSRYQGYVHMEPFTAALLTGWAVDESRPGTALNVEILLHGRSIAVVRADLFREDLLATPAFSGKCGFSYAIRGQEQLDQSSVIRAKIQGTQYDLRGSPVLYLDTSRFLNTLQRVNSAFRFVHETASSRLQQAGPELQLTEGERKTFAEMLLGTNNLAELMELSRWFQAAGNQHIAAATHRHRFYTYLSENFAGSAAIRHSPVSDTWTDVIFCLHAKADPVRVMQAFDRLLNSTQNRPFSVICAGDSSFLDRDALMRVAAGRDVAFLEETVLEGFSPPVNRAVALHPERDLVLLDCETLVFGNWLARLRDAAASSPAAGIIVPLATSGEVCRYPVPGLALITAEELDALCEIANAGVSVDLPAAHGLCALLRRPCLDEVGRFDEGSLKRDAAVADFCLRAGNRGWRTVLAAGILVDSKGDEIPCEEYHTTLDTCHPYYGDLLINFNLDDPTLPQRRNLDLAILGRLNRPFYCFLTHRFGGGTERHVRDLCKALSAEGVPCLVLFALDGNRASCIAPAIPGLVNLRYQLDREMDTLVRDLKKLGISHFHIHSNITIPRELMLLPERLGVGYDCTIHDYSWFCPRVNLVDDSGAYCGEPEAAVCDECIGRGDPGLWRDFRSAYASVGDLRSQSQSVLAGAGRVFCPSRDTKVRMARQFKLHNLEVRPNVEILDAPAPRPGEWDPAAPAGVASIGFLSRKKGMDVLLQCAKAAQRDSLPLRFIVVGFTEDDSKFDGLANVTITGRYQEGEAEKVIRKHNPRLAFFPVLWPETYSYTLSIALHSGLYPVGFDLGAIAERIRDMKYGQLLPLDTSPEEINALLLACASMGHEAPPPSVWAEPPNVLDYYYDSEPAIP